MRQHTAASVIDFRLHPADAFKSRAVRDGKGRTLQNDEMLVLEIAERTRDGLAGRPDKRRNLFVREWKLDLCSCLGQLSFGGPVEQKARYFLRNGSRKAHSTQLLTGSVVERCGLLNYSLMHLGMLCEKPKEIIAADEGELAGMQGFRSYFVRCVGENRHQSEDFAGLGNAENERLAGT